MLLLRLSTTMQGGDQISVLLITSLLGAHCLRIVLGT